MRRMYSHPGEYRKILLVNIYGGGLVFSLPFCLFEKQKQHALAILRQKGGKGRKIKKDDQNWSCFSGPKNALFPQF